MAKFLFLLLSSLVSFQAFAQSDLQEYQKNIVAALSGADEIVPNIQLGDRYTTTNKLVTRNYLKKLLTDIGVTAESHAYRKSAENIYGTIKSTTGSSESIIIGAHFDSVRGVPGANDNATGIALSMGIAREIMDAECRNQNLIIVFFDEEELGLIGSRYFAKYLVKKGSKISTVHTIDQIGWDSDGDRAIELELPSQNLLSTYRRVALEKGFNIPIHRTSTGSTDHSSFRREGFESVGITEEYVNGDTTPHYHRSSDTFDTVDFNYLEDTTILIEAVIGELITKGCES